MCNSLFIYFGGISKMDIKPCTVVENEVISARMEQMVEAEPDTKPLEVVEVNSNPSGVTENGQSLKLTNVSKHKIEQSQNEENNNPINNVEKNILKTAVITPENNQNLTPICCICITEIERGPFITALGKIWCPEHFVCTTQNCRRPLADIGFIEEQGQLYCEFCFEQYLAPPCAKCGIKIKGDCLKAIGKTFHPECFNCSYCGKLFGNSPFFLEDGQPYCETDWNEMFTTKCFACGFPVEAGDRWVEALNNNYHSQCFNCTMCKKNLEGQSFFAKGGRPFCKNHAR